MYRYAKHIEPNQITTRSYSWGQDLKIMNDICQYLLYMFINVLNLVNVCKVHLISHVWANGGYPSPTAINLLNFWSAQNFILFAEPHKNWNNRILCTLLLFFSYIIRLSQNKPLERIQMHFYFAYFFSNEFPYFNFKHHVSNTQHAKKRKTYFIFLFLDSEANRNMDVQAMW